MAVAGDRNSCATIARNSSLSSLEGRSASSLLRPLEQIRIVELAAAAAYRSDLASACKASDLATGDYARRSSPVANLTCRRGFGRRSARQPPANLRPAQPRRAPPPTVLHPSPRRSRCSAVRSEPWQSASADALGLSDGPGLGDGVGLDDGPGLGDGVGLGTRSSHPWHASRTLPTTPTSRIYDTERLLLYVAYTRARDHLMVTGVSPASECLNHLRAAPIVGAPGCASIDYSARCERAPPSPTRSASSSHRGCSRRDEIVHATTLPAGQLLLVRVEFIVEPDDS